MKEVKTPKKPLIYYYGIVLLVLIVFNLVVSPILMEHQVEETDYGTFMSMINDKNIGKVEVEDNQIVFTDKNNEKIYKTGLMNDPDLTDRLYECGATFTKDIDLPDSQLPGNRTFASAHFHSSWKLYGEEADGTGWRQKLHGICHGEKQCKGLRSVQ